MLSKHFIEWVYVQTENGGQRKALKPDDKPNVTFCLGDDKAVAVLLILERLIDTLRVRTT